MNIEVEFNFKNQDWYFPPLDRNIRGEFQLQRVAEPTAMSFRDKIPDLPAQIVGIDGTTGYVVEPIQKLPLLKRDIERKGFELEPERAEFPDIDVDAWLYWMRAGIQAGTVVLKKGKLPETINYTPPENPLAPPPKRGDALKREIFRKEPAVAAQYLEWPESKRKEWEALVGV